MLSLGLLAASLVAVLFLCLLLRPVVEYLRDPLDLRKYPSPSIFASISSLWLMRITWNQNRSVVIHEEHQKLGDVIRVSPDHLIFNDPRAIKDIYGVLAISKGTYKDAFYDRLAGEFHDLVQLRDRGEHSERRKALTNAFAFKTVINMEPVIRRTFARLLHQLEKHIDANSSPDAGSQVLNIRRWLNYFTLDVIGDMGFGRPMGFLTNGDDAATAETMSGSQYLVDSTIGAFNRVSRYAVFIAQPRSIRVVRFLKYMISRIKPLARTLGAQGGVDYEAVCIHQLKTRISQGSPARASGDFFGFVLNPRFSKTDSTKSDGTAQAPFRKLVADATMMMGAGSDTTAAALTYTLFFLLKNPDAMARLREELDRCYDQTQFSVGDMEDRILHYDTVKDLPYLRACVDESLRLQPPIAYQLPRVVSNPNGITIAGRHVKCGTVVAVSPYSIHRHKGLFPRPDEYNPSRWIELDSEFPTQREDLKTYNIAFSQGSRACIGRHVAMIELLILISSLVVNYDFELAEGPEQQIIVNDWFVANPGPLPIRIRRRNVSIKSGLSGQGAFLEDM